MTAFAELDDVTFNLEVDGDVAREELARKVWEHAGRATVACVYRERARDGAWRSPKIALIRLRRQHDMWKREASMTLAGTLTLELVQAIEGWRTWLEPTEAED